MWCLTLCVWKQAEASRCAHPAGHSCKRLEPSWAPELLVFLTHACAQQHQCACSGAAGDPYRLYSCYFGLTLSQPLAVRVQIVCSLLPCMPAYLAAQVEEELGDADIWSEQLLWLGNPEPLRKRARATGVSCKRLWVAHA